MNKETLTRTNRCPRSIYLFFQFSTSDIERSGVDEREMVGSVSGEVASRILHSRGVQIVVIL